MQDAIKNFATQFAFNPKIANKQYLKKKKHVIVLGMGGSHLAADLILTSDPSMSLTVHSDYGLPSLPKQRLKESLIIASSYSGNTEEVLDGLRQARKLKLDTAIISVGGKLIELAKKHHIPYVLLPDTGIQPRSALGYCLLATLKLMKKEKMIQEAKLLEKTLDPNKLKTKGRLLAKKLKHRIPIIYASRTNQAIAYNWKIKFNETGKIPAFYNIFPELNHNEMTGFDVQPSSQHLSNDFSFIILKDTTDHTQIQKRMDVVKKLYKKRTLPVHDIPLEGKTVWEKIFTSLIIADWTALFTAQYYHLESEQVPMVATFKKMIV